MKRWLVHFALAATSTTFAQTGLSVPGATVESLLDVARQQSPELAAMRHDAMAAQERAGQADALPDPRIRVELLDITRSATQNPTLWPSDVGSTRYTLMQELPWFGTRDLRRAQAQAGADAAEASVQAGWVDLAARIKLSYAQLYYLSRSQQLDEELLGITQQLEQIARTRYAAGLAPQQDVIRAQTEQTALRSELLSIDAQVRQARMRMNNLLARPLQAELAEPQGLRPLPAPQSLDLDQLLKKVREHNPQVAAEAARVQAADKGVALASLASYPTVTLGVAPTQVQNDVKTWDLMLEMNIPLWQGARRAQERESVGMLAAAQDRRDAVLNQLTGELGENLVALQTAQRTEALVSNSLVPQAELTLQAALAGYETGKVDFATVLDAQRRDRQAKLERIKAQAEGQARLAQLERLLGDDL